MSAPVHPETLPPALRVSIERNAQALARAFADSLPADRGPLAATKDVRRAVRAALCAQRSEYGPPTTVARYLSTHHARQLGHSLLAAADYTDQEDTRP